MNWKNVFRLVNVNIKSYRMIRGSRLRKFRENRFVTYALYIGACGIGALIGWLGGNFYTGLSGLAIQDTILDGAKSLFISLPTISLLYGLVLTQITQFQRVGAKVSIQPIYWFPISWQEHTLASIISNMLGTPMIVTALICSGVLAASLFLELVPLAILTTIALFISLLLASVTTEVFKTLNIRLSGAMTKMAGRAAIWLRLLGSIGTMVVFYIIYFSIYSSTTPLTLFGTVAGGQQALWFIPYVWPGIALSSFASSLWVETAVFLLSSTAFICAVFLAATRLNMRFGMYEMPSIKLSYGEYSPKVGFLGKLGFSPVEAAIMRKDFKSFIRRHELLYIFIFPIIFMVMPIFTTMRMEAGAGNPMPAAFPSFLFVYMTVFPGTLLAVIIGSIITGSEGESVWYLYSSPVSAKCLFRAKYGFVLLFSLTITLACAVISGLLFVPSLQMALLGSFESVFLVVSLTTISISFGVRGADFRELFPRSRMIRPKWSIINFIICVLAGLAVIAPTIPVLMNFVFGSLAPSSIVFVPFPEYFLYLGLVLSGVIAAAMVYVFRKIALDNAERLLVDAERL
jgi:hypothetical protein